MEHAAAPRVLRPSARARVRRPAARGGGGGHQGAAAPAATIRTKYACAQVEMSELIVAGKVMSKWVSAQPTKDKPPLGLRHSQSEVAANIDTGLGSAQARVIALVFSI
jgi:hypothetical protein